MKTQNINMRISAEHKAILHRLRGERTISQYIIHLIMEDEKRLIREQAVEEYKAQRKADV